MPPELLRELRGAAGDQLPAGAGAGRPDGRARRPAARRSHPAVAAAMAAGGLTALRARAGRGRQPGGWALLVLGLGDPDVRGPDQPRRAGAGRPTEPADVDLLWTLGRQAGQALERARLHEETARQAERVGVPARGRAAAGARPPTSPRPWSGWPSSPSPGWPTCASSTSRPSTGRPARPCGTATPPGSPWPTSCASVHLPLGGRPHPSVQAHAGGRARSGCARWTTQYRARDVARRAAPRAGCGRWS